MRIELSWLVGIDQWLHVVTIRIHRISLLLNDRLLHHDGLHMLLLVLLLVHHLLLLHAGLRLSGVVLGGDRRILVVVDVTRELRSSSCGPTAATAYAADNAQEDESEDAEENIEHRGRSIALSLSSTDTVNGAAEWAVSDWDLAIGTI